MKQLIPLITLVTITAFTLIINSFAHAQSSENRIFYIESDGLESENKIHSFDPDQPESETTQVWNSSVSFENGYYNADEDSVILVNNSNIYKTDRLFRSFRKLYTLPNSMSNLYTDYHLQTGSIFFTYNSEIRKLELETDEITTVITVDGDIDALTVSNSGTVYWAENFGFGNRAIQSYTTDGDTLVHHTLTSGIYTSLIVDSSDENIYFSQNNFGSYTLNHVDLETNEETTLHTSPQNIRNIRLNESADKLYLISLSDQTSLIQLNLSDTGSSEAVYSGTENIAAFILDDHAGSVIIRTLDGVFDYNLDHEETERLTIPAFFNRVLVADPANEYLYLVSEGIPHRLLRTDFSGTEFTSLKEFNITGTTFRRAHLDIENNDLYLITARRLYRMNLDDEEGEETILTLDFGNSIEGFDLDLENGVIYYYLNRDGIYQSDLNGEGYERIATGIAFRDSGLAFNPDQGKIYFSSSDWIYSAESDGSGRENYHDRYDGFVPDIQYNQVRKQIVYIDRILGGTDRLRYRNTDTENEPVLGVYHSAASITAFSALLTTADIVETSSELSRELPQTTRLNQNYPNPFNPSTVISYEISSNTDVYLDVFDLTGRHVASLVNEQQSAGLYAVQFDGSRLASGIYLYRLTAGETVLTRKLSLIK